MTAEPKVISEIGKEDDWFADLIDRPVKQFGLINKVRYDHAHKRWHVWNGIRWEPDRTRNVYEILRTSLGFWLKGTQPGSAAAKTLMALKNLNKKESVLNSAASRPTFAMRGDEWDPYPHIIGCQNGLVNLETGYFLPGEHPEMLVTKSVRAKWDPTAECPLFLKFLAEIMAGDVEKQRYLLRVLGYMMFGHQAEQKFWLLTGAGNNGKGVLTKTIAWVMGDYAAFPPSTLYMQTRHGDTVSSAPRADLLDLQGLRFTPISEPPGGKFNDELLKAHTGADPIRARNLNSPLFIEFPPTHTIFMSANKLPSIADTGKSMQRRVRVIWFTEDFSGARADLTLEEKLRDEADGIFRLLVEAAVTWHEQGLEEPLSILEASQRYIEDNDPISEFCYDRCLVGPEYEDSAAILYNGYVEWCRANSVDLDDRMTSKAFGIELGLRFKKARKAAGMRYTGIRLKTAVEIAAGEGS